MRCSAMWFWLIAATALVAVQRPGLSAEMQNPYPAEADVTVARQDRKAAADALLIY